LELKDLFWDRVSAIPGYNLADKLKEIYQNTFLDQFITLIEYAEQILEEQYTAVKQHLYLLKMDPPNFISSKLYMMYYKLRQLMEQDDILSVKQLISSLEGTESRISRCTIEAGLTSALELELFNKEVLVSFGIDEFRASSPSETTLNLFKQNILQTLSLIEVADPSFAQEIQALISTIFLVNSPTGVGATSPKFFGAVYVTLPPDDLISGRLLLLVDNLVHETSHLYLNTLLLHDPLVLNHSEPFFSPVRKTLRPMIGIYHAMFVFSRVIRVLKKILEMNLHPDHLLNKKIINGTLKVYEDSYKIIDQHAKLTELGKKIHQTTRACALLE
jgi:hypothetical protein